MRIPRSAIVALLLLVAVGSTFAQGRNAQLELYGGLALPLSPDDFKDYFKNGLSLHGQYVLFPSPRFGVSIGAAYERFSFDEEALLTDLEDAYGVDLSGVSIKGSASIVEFGVGFRPYLTAPEANTQFFLFGMGTYNLLKTEWTLEAFGESLSDDVDDKKFGIAGGAGLEIPAGETLNIILQGLFRSVFTEGESTSFVGLTAGLVF